MGSYAFISLSRFRPSFVFHSHVHIRSTSSCHCLLLFADGCPFKKRWQQNTGQLNRMAFILTQWCQCVKMEGIWLCQRILMSSCLEPDHVIADFNKTTTHWYYFLTSTRVHWHHPDHHQSALTPSWSNKSILMHPGQNQSMLTQVCSESKYTNTQPTYLPLIGIKVHWHDSDQNQSTLTPSV